MEINDYLSRINLSTDLPIIEELLSHAKVHVSFLGKRVITVPSYKGAIELSSLAQRIFSLSEEGNCLELTEESLRAGLKILARLEKGYHITDRQLERRNPFTRLCNLIRSFTDPLSS